MIIAVRLDVEFLDGSWAKSRPPTEEKVVDASVGFTS